MKVIIGSRGSGKSTEAIRESVRTGARIAVMSKQQGKLILDMAKDMGIEGLPEPIVLSGRNSEAIGIRDEVILENADAFLRDMFGLNVTTITMSSENIVNLDDNEGDD